MTASPDDVVPDAAPTPPTEPAESRWASSVVLGSGDSAFIRPLTTADKEALAEFHAQQSPDSIYRRYFSPKPTLSAKELEHFTNIDMADRVALAVELQDEFVAWASYERWPGRNEAEAAFMVSDEHHGQGIATLLLEHLAAIARSNGIERFTAEVLGDNRAMLAVFAKAGWPLQRRFDSGVIDLDWELATTEEFLDSVERREQRADSRAVARILLPKAIAVVGASNRPDSVGTPLWRHVIDSVNVPAYPVNPAHEELDGRRCYRSVDDLPDEVSLAIIAVPPAVLEATIDACIAKRMRGAVIITDVDGPGAGVTIDLPALVTRSRRNGLRLIGPSSMGVASPRASSRLQAALVDVTVPAGGVAVSLQSGTLGGSLLRRARDLELGLSWFVSLGDRSDISGNDLLQFWEDDDETRVICMYTESFGNPRKFARIARRVSRSRPIVAVRTGAAADGNLGSALYQQAGLIEVPTVHALLDTARVLATQPVLRGPNITVVTNSRSPGTLAAAALGTAGLKVAEIVRLPADAPPEAFSAAITTALGSDGADGVLVIHAPALPSGTDSAVATNIDDAARGSVKPVVAVLLGSADGPLAEKSPVPVFGFPEQAAAVLGRCWGYGRWLASEALESTPPRTTIDPPAAAAVITELLDSAEADALLDAAAQQRLLATYGISMAAAENATPGTAVEVAARLGYPVAIKAAGRTIGRSVLAGVALDLCNDDDVIESVAQMHASLGDGANSLTVQQMAQPGYDIQIRCVHDDRLGVIVSVGLGGAQADVIDDRTSRLAPVQPSSAAAMLRETKVAAALADAGLDSSLLIEMICLAAQLAADHPQIAELDLNPVIVSAAQTVVTDAAIRLASHEHEAGPLRKLE